MLTLYHDVTSPASAVALRRLQRLADEGFDVEFEGFEAVGIDMVVPATVDVLAEHETVAPLAAAEGVALRRPRELPPTVLCHVIDRLAPDGRGPAWRDAVYTAFWRDGADIADPGLLLELAARCGIDRDRAAAALADSGASAAVRRRTAQLRREGVGGVPTILSQRTLVPGLMAVEDLRSLAAL